MITLEWDKHTARVPHASTRWASSDRGWLFASRAPRRIGAVYGRDYVTLGHYLAYSPHALDYVHAVSCVTRESTWHETAESAATWIETQARGKVSVYFGDEHRRFGGYVLEADKITRTAVRSEITERTC